MGYAKPELSKRNPYWISKEKYYELMHFCRQYDDFKAQLADLETQYPTQMVDDIKVDSHNDYSLDLLVSEMEKLQAKISMIEQCVIEAEPTLCKWLLLGVTKDYSYGYLSVKLGMPASKDMYYDRYRKFFYLLAQKR